MVPSRVWLPCLECPLLGQPKRRIPRAHWVSLMNQTFIIITMSKSTHLPFLLNILDCLYLNYYFRRYLYHYNVFMIMVSLLWSLSSPISLFIIVVISEFLLLPMSLLSLLSQAIWLWSPVVIMIINFLSLLPFFHILYYNLLCHYCKCFHHFSPFSLPLSWYSSSKLSSS